MTKVIFTQNFKRRKKPDGSTEKVYEFPYTHVDGVLTDGGTLGKELEELKAENEALKDKITKIENLLKQGIVLLASE